MVTIVQILHYKKNSSDFEGCYIMENEYGEEFDMMGRASGGMWLFSYFTVSEFFGCNSN